VGLITLLLKIKDKKTSYFLLKVNGWAVYTMLILMSLVDWDILIVTHNIEHYKQLSNKRKEIDIAFLLLMADKTLPILQAHRKELPLTPEDSQKLAMRIHYFLKTQAKYSFWSWTYEEEQAVLSLRKDLYKVEIK